MLVLGLKVVQFPIIIFYVTHCTYLNKVQLPDLEEAQDDCDGHQGVDDGVVDVDEEYGYQMKLLLVHYRKQQKWVQSLIRVCVLRLSVYPSICLSVYLTICLSTYISICLYVYLSICLSVYLSTCYLAICLYITTPNIVDEFCLLPKAK